MDVPSTQWSLVDRAAASEPQIRRAAIDQLLARYLPALRAHLIHNRHVPPAIASDLLQSFVADLVIEKQVFSRADRCRGRFRDFLRTALDNYVSNARDAANCRKRNPGTVLPLNDNLAVRRNGNGRVGHPDPFIVAWARETLRQAVREMKSECERSGRSDVWTIFERRLLRPLFDDEPAVSYQALAGELRLQSETQAFNLLVTAKRRFHGVLCRLISQYVDDDAEVEAEIDDLFNALSSRSA